MEDFVQIASELISRKKLSRARKILDAGISQMPANWRATREQGDRLEISCWDYGEFDSFREYSRLGCDADKMIVWKGTSYSKAYYLLAYIDVEEGRMEKALIPLERGLELEGDHPQLLCEKALIFELLNRNEEALLLYERAANSRAWVSVAAKARALRGQASCLTALGRFEAAERLLQESLTLDPQSQAAKDQFEQIQSLGTAELYSSAPYQEYAQRKELQNSTVEERSVPLEMGWITQYGGYLVDLAIVVAVFVNGPAALFHFYSGHIVLGIWSLIGILILPKAALGLLLLFGRRTGVSAALPIFVYSIFKGTLRKYSHWEYPPIGTRVVRLATYEILSVVVALTPAAIWIFSLE